MRNEFNIHHIDHEKSIKTQHLNKSKLHLNKRVIVFQAILFAKFQMYFSDNLSYVVLVENLLLSIKEQNINIKTMISTISN